MSGPAPGAPNRISKRGRALVTRRRVALVVLAVVAVVQLILRWRMGNEGLFIAITALALYTVASTGERRSSLALALAIATGLAAGIAAIDRDPFALEFIGEWAINLVPIAVADAVRSRADRLQTMIDAEADKRVQAERLRIARDLHDVVAHGLSTIAVQSGVAAHLLDQNPDQAKEALEAINTTGRKSLDELRSMVGVLRSSETAALLPIPAEPDDLDAIIDGATNAGVMVSTEVDGAFPPDVGDSCIVAVHRILQEALTNVARHAGAVPTEVRLIHGQQQVELTVTNGPGGGQAGRNGSVRGGAAEGGTEGVSGVGIVGMTERAESLGGTLTAGPTTDGGYQVAAVLPYSVRAG